jgi:hypothetical protein
MSQAAENTSQAYEALEGLFDDITEFLKRLEVYLSPSNPPIVMKEIFVKMLTITVAVLAEATKDAKAGSLGESIYDLLRIYKW